MLNPDLQPCPPFQSAVTEELVKWVWLGLKTVIIVNDGKNTVIIVNDGKNTEKDNKL